MPNLSSKLNKTLSLPAIKNREKNQIYRIDSSKRQLNCLPYISTNDKKPPLTQRLQRSIDKIMYGAMQQKQILTTKDVIINQQLQQVKIVLQRIHQIKLQLEKYNANHSLKKIYVTIQRMKQKQLIRYIWNRNTCIKQEKIKRFLQKYTTLLKDANYLVNISKNVLSTFKINRWGNIDADINRKKNSLERAVFKVGNKINNCQSQVKRTIIDAVSKINPQCPANRLEYKQWSSRAEKQLRSRKIFNQLLEHQVYSKF